MANNELEMLSFVFLTHGMFLLIILHKYHTLLPFHFLLKTTIDKDSVSFYDICNRLHI